MLKRLIEISLENRFLVIVLALFVAGAGMRSALQLPIDAVPDLTNTQVTVLPKRGHCHPWRSSDRSPIP